VQPALAALGQRDPQVELVRRAVLDRRGDQPAERLAVLGMDDPVEEILHAAGLDPAREPVERAHVLGPLDVVGGDVPLPEARLSAFQGEPQALLEGLHGRGSLHRYG
jgi:hypothetical protein